MFFYVFFLKKQKVNAYIESTVLESIRCANNSNNESTLVYPYIWFRYHNGSTLLSKDDLTSVIQNPYNLGAQGLVIWGGNENNHSDFWDYFTNIAGPLIQGFYCYLSFFDFCFDLVFFCRAK